MHKALLGKAGVGKSYTIKKLLEKDPKYGLKTASTGIAAINLQDENGSATTINAALGYFDSKELLFQTLNEGRIDEKLNEIADNYKHLIIDEVSMMGSSQLDLIYRVVQRVNMKREKNGKNPIYLKVVGDFGQLPPIKEKPSFLSKCWPNFDITYLTEVKRQDEKDFIEALSHVRNGDTQAALPYFQSNIQFHKYVDRNFKGSTFMSRNRDVDAFNNMKLDELPGKDIYIKSSRWGKEKPEWKNIPKSLRLKEGALVVILMNNHKSAYANGDLGYVDKVNNDDSVDVILQRDGRLVTVELAEVFNKSMGGTKLGGITYSPLRVAFAMTVHKCVSENTLISTANGIKKISEVQVGEKVLTSKGRFKEVITTTCSGIKNLLRIRTRSGFTIEVTPEHRLMIGGEKVLSYVKSGDLLIGDHLCLSREFKELTHQTTLPAGIGKSYLSSDLSWLFGALIGDGSFTDTKEGRIDFSNKDHCLIQEVSSILSGLGVKPHLRDLPRCKNIYVISKALRKWMFDIGFHYSKANEKVIPDLLISANTENVGNLLAGLWDTDGSTKSRIRYVTTSKQLAQQVSLLLLALGIPSYMNSQVEKDYGLDSFTIHVSNRFSKLFQQRVPLRSAEKISDLGAIVESSPTSGKTSNDFIPYGKELAKCIIDVVPPGKKSNPTFRHLGQVKRGAIRLQYTLLKDSLDLLKEYEVEIPTKALDCLNCNYYYDPIVSIEECGSATTYDLEIEEDHSFIANGIVSHNSQGLTLDNVQIVMGDSFMSRCHGMFYVALSRTKTSHGLRLVGSQEDFLKSACFDSQYRSYVK